jgi:hypothetical protein
MDREKLIEDLDSGAIALDEDDAITSPGSGSSEAMRMNIAKLQEKKTSTGRVYGEKREKEKRLTAKQRAFASYIVQGDSPQVAYRKAYDVKTVNSASVISGANKLMKDGRISALIGSVFDRTKEMIIADAVATRRHVMEELFKHHENEKHNVSARLKALELMGRAVGMFTDKVEQKVEEISTERLKDELKSHLALLDNVKPIKKRSA